MSVPPHEALGPGSGAAATRLLWQVGRIALNEATRELRYDDAPVEIEPKPLDLLIFLLHRAGEVVTREEILAAIWPGRVVTDGVVTNCVAKLREALREPDVIRTVPRYGYRLFGEVKCVRLGASTAMTNDLALSAGEPLPHRAHWQLAQQLSSGAQGEVWLARHTQTQALRTIKFGRDAESLHALRREVTLNRVLSGTLGETDYFVRVLDWNLDEAPFFIETEYSAQGNLAQWCAARGGVETLPLSLRLELVAQCAVAVAAAHSAGVLHKDLKPGNIIVFADDRGHPRAQLCDFASGRMLDSEQLIELGITRMGLTQLQSDQDISGTPLYLAPELIAGQPPTTLSDVYALGCLLYQMVVGDLHRVLAPGWENDIDDALLREDIAEAAAGNPNRRLADAGQLALRLRSLPARQAESERLQRAERTAQSLRQQMLRAQARRGLLVALIATLALAAAAMSALYLRESAAVKARNCPSLPDQPPANPFN